jgi:transcriptional regulator with XRE-family HTH domain
MNGLEKARLELGFTQEQMASELCITPNEYKRYAKNISVIPLPILKLASLITKKPTCYLLGEV